VGKCSAVEEVQSRNCAYFWSRTLGWTGYDAADVDEDKNIENQVDMSIFLRLASAYLVAPQFLLQGRDALEEDATIL
jgi:hypothetical protein